MARYGNGVGDGRSEGGLWSRAMHPLDTRTPLPVYVLPLLLTGVLAAVLLYTGRLTRRPTRAPSRFTAHATRTIRRSLDEVARFCTKLEHLPRFIAHLQHVEELDERRSRWTAQVPGGLKVTWESTVTQLGPHTIAWQAQEGAEVVAQGRLRLRAGDRTETIVTAELEYRPTVFPLGSALARVFGDVANHPEALLERLSRVIEHDEPPLAEPEAQRRIGPAEGLAGSQGGTGSGMAT